MDFASQTVELRPITRDDWEQIVARHAMNEEEPPIRRGDRRHAVDYGTAKLVFMQDTLGRLRTIVRTTPLLQISREGMMVKSHADVPVDAVVGLRVELGEDSFALLGRVVHSTQTLAGYKVGLQLAFLEPSRSGG